MDILEQSLDRHFGFKEFRPGQKQVIQSLLEGRSALAIFPTGGGKSLCYQLPALLMGGVTLVVSPLIALMKDQIDQLQALHLPAARLDSSLNPAQTQDIMRQLHDGQLKLLYVSPERFKNERFIIQLSQLPIAMMAIDEAHCISEWGHNFRPDYLKLAPLSRSLGVGRVLALTATATPEVADDICRQFDIQAQDRMHTGFYRPNLDLDIAPQSIEQRDEYLENLLNGRQQKHGAEPSIVYVTLQKTAEQVAERLSTTGLRAQPYHAGLKDDVRHAIQEAFMRGEVDIVVATIAFGMGIDKANIRAIVHYNLPKSLENYMQEIGRAGRDGQSAQCTLIPSGDDLTVLQNFVYGDTPERESLSQCIEWIMTLAGDFDLAAYELSYQYDMRPLVITTLLTYLELDGIIQATAVFYTDYKIQFLEPAETIFSHFDQNRSDFLRTVFAAGKKGRKWLTVKPREVAEALGEERLRIVKALNYLEEKGLIELSLSGVRQGYRRMDSNIDNDALCEKMFKLFARREQREIDRLQEVCRWVESDSCYSNALMAYFGEQRPQACGHCSHCRGKAASQLPTSEYQDVDSRSFAGYYRRCPEVIERPRQLARFLCGITSPRLSRAGSLKHPDFGALSDQPFPQVLSACVEAMGQISGG